MARPAFDDPDQMLSELMIRWPETIPVFMRHRMLCVGCSINPFHTITDACIEHGVDEDQFVEELRCAITPQPRSARPVHAGDKP